MDERRKSILDELKGEIKSINENIDNLLYNDPEESVASSLNLIKQSLVDFVDRTSVHPFKMKDVLLLVERLRKSTNFCCKDEFVSILKDAFSNGETFTDRVWKLVNKKV